MTLNRLTRQAAEEATDVMSPLKQECASQEARALPVSPTSHRLTKAHCLQGGLSRAVRPCAGEAASAPPEGCALCPHVVPVGAEYLFASRNPAWRRGQGPVWRVR